MTGKKTKAQAKSVWLIQVTCTSLSNSYNSFMIYPVPDSSLTLIKVLSNENSFQVISFVEQKTQSLLNREKNTQASIMFRPPSGNRQQLLIHYQP